MSAVGVDIAKQTLAVTVLGVEGQRYREFANRRAGFEQLLKWLHEQSDGALHVCMEATNTYWEALALWLHDQAVRVSVVNPLAIKGYAQSEMARSKTDTLDSRVIAHFCAEKQPAAWQPPNGAQRTIRALQRHKKGLLKTLTQQKNRRSTASESAVQESLDALIEYLEAEIQALEQQIEQTMAADATLQQQHDLLCSIPGIGSKTAHSLRAELGDLLRYASARALAAHVGLTPAQHESGTSVHKRARISKLGNAAVRGALYLPAKAALRSNRIVQAQATRLEEKGKPYGVIVTAAMRKLLHIAYGVVKHGVPFDPAYAI
jgi:transposase